VRIKWSRVFILCVIFLIIGVGVYLIINKYNSNKLISDIKNHYSKSVLINKNSNLYILEDDKYKPVITLKEEISLNLDDVKEFDIDTKYFKIKGTEYYAYYKNCKEFKEVVEKYGLPIKEFFIWTDDWEFTRRISRKEINSYKNIFIFIN